MMLKTNWVWCTRWGRRHSMVCYLRCKGPKECNSLRDHEWEQSRFIERSRQDKVSPAEQRLLPGWVFQEWPEDKKQEKKEKEEEGEEVV